eukprot:gene655-438_t
MRAAIVASLLAAVAAQHMYSSRYTALWNSPWPSNCGAGGVQPRWSQWNISTNKNASFLGSVVATIYEAGNFPMFSGMGPGGACADGDWNCTNASAVFGGLPQLTNLSAHLAKLQLDIEEILPDPSWSGVANIDWEAWKPTFAANRYNEYWIYINRSEALVLQQHPSWPSDRVAAEAERQFNSAAQQFWGETLRLCKRLRPHGVWGFYNYPVDAWDAASGSDARLNWLFDEVTALFPSIYLYKLGDPGFNQQYVDRVLNQTRAVRDARFERSGDLLPMYRRVAAHLYVGVCPPHIDAWPLANGLLPPMCSFTWYDYDIPSHTSYLSPADIEAEMVRGATRWGLAGTLLWGASADARNATRCAAGAGSLASFVEGSLGPAVLRASGAANACSDSRCSGHGRCWGATGAGACDCDEGFSGADCSSKTQ